MTDAGPVRHFLALAAQLATRVQLGKVNDEEAEIAALAAEVLKQAAALPRGRVFVTALLGQLKMQAASDAPERAALIRKLMAAIPEPR